MKWLRARQLVRMPKDVQLILGVPMPSLREIYTRFKENYRTENGGINIYPQFDTDLNALLEWIEGELDFTFDMYYDCGWRMPEGEDE